jgi:hypothetical protein
LPNSIGSPIAAMEGLMTGAIFNGQHYSARNVSMESTRVARAAGSRQAPMAVMSSNDGAVGRHTK